MSFVDCLQTKIDGLLNGNKCVIMDIGNNYLPKLWITSSSISENLTLNVGYKLFVTKNK